ncbi:MAG: ATP synthase F0 subunit B [Eubacterium sp.]|jgi:cell division septum initiation protein DivIVA|nr:ATP synthase F0 subunit B [Eubacterium sp.]MCI9564526.1 ATP synthase F0 subunit B [Eubacterium sp.]MCI9617188.1 ATP synthase F0 subunit B [Eubacterium sp.]
MSSKIEQIITEIEEYIDNCKFQPLSTSKIVVNKDDIDELLAELRLRTPDEIKKYQKIIANKDAILNDAKERSESMIAEATAHINQLVSEHEIMQKAYNEANQVLEQAQQEAQDILNKATVEANDLRGRAMQYTDDILSNVQSILSTGMDSFENAQNQMMSSLNSSLNVVIESRKELGGQDVSEEDYDADGVDDIEVDLL